MLRLSVKLLQQTFAAHLEIVLRVRNVAVCVAKCGINLITIDEFRLNNDLTRSVRTRRFIKFYKTLPLILRK